MIKSLYLAGFLYTLTLIFNFLIHGSKECPLFDSRNPKMNAQIRYVNEHGRAIFCHDFCTSDEYLCFGDLSRQGNPEIGILPYLIA
ncbi:unnamed protein product [Gordionus sp. m RMFG-2023]